MSSLSHSCTSNTAKDPPLPSPLSLSPPSAAAASSIDRACQVAFLCQAPPLSPRVLFSSNLPTPFLHYHPTSASSGRSTGRSSFANLELQPFIAAAISCSTASPSLLGAALHCCSPRPPPLLYYRFAATASSLPPLLERPPLPLRTDLI
ncbi:hypothetical protein CRG98_006401 [Punica granatum]|uniref:Uncharacterized protein n=1 Tax=Punica granatum TaxID=22663 RepID=A0A2I0KXW9_PUNGR|nr:hypothetical protein CRG98_006401 [Punica granatum]